MPTEAVDLAVQSGVNYQSAYIKNKTSLSDGQIAELLGTGPGAKIQLGSDQPQVLIVHTHATESYEQMCIRDSLYTGHGLGGGVQPPQGPQLPFHRRLHPQGEAVEPRLAQGAQLLPPHRAGVCLQGDLRPGVQLETAPQLCQHPRQLPPEQAGGASAEIDGVHRPPAQPLPPCLLYTSRCV